MKSKFKFIVLLSLFIQQTVYSQWQTNGTNIYTPTTNNVGIGTATPLKRFEIWDGVTGRFTFSATNCTSGYPVENTVDNYGYRLNVGSSIRNYYLSINNTNRLSILYNGGVGINCNPGTTTFKIYQLANPNLIIASDKGRLEFGSSTCDGCYATGAKVGDGVIRTVGTTHNLLLSMPNNSNDGSSYIGINDEANGVWCKFFNNKTLRVDGKIYATEINVQANVWADNVFNANYKLKTLDEIDIFIKNNNHLPDVPSEKDVKDNGINLAKMNAILLQKVEELTLLMIEQNKTIKNLQNEVSELKK